MSFQQETASSGIIRSALKDSATELRRLEIENPEEYARIIARSRETSEKYRRLARGGK